MVGTVIVNARYKFRPVSGVERYACEVEKRLKGKLQPVFPEAFPRGWSGHLWEQVLLPIKVGKQDLLWSPANTGPMKMGNQVATIHDLSPLEHPEWFAPEFATWYRYMLPRLSGVVSKVITISEFSKQRMVEILKLSEDKIVVAPGGVDRKIFHPVNNSDVEIVCKRLGVKIPYLLAINPKNPRKNAINLLKAWEVIRLKYPDLHLVLLASEKKAFVMGEHAPSTNRIIRLRYVNDSDLVALMNGAEVFVYPSLYEGFGLCVLEAMACGTPVLASAKGGLSEAVGDAGYLVDPADVDGLIDGMGCLLMDSAIRNDLITKGSRRAAHFEWDSTARIVEKTLGIDQIS
jgi:glycosyltransferase involved in cell wall biosynthesis